MADGQVAGNPVGKRISRVERKATPRVHLFLGTNVYECVQIVIKNSKRKKRRKKREKKRKGEKAKTGKKATPAPRYRFRPIPSERACTVSQADGQWWTAQDCPLVHPERRHPRSNPYVLRTLVSKPKQIWPLHRPPLISGEAILFPEAFCAARRENSIICLYQVCRHVYANEHASTGAASATAAVFMARFRRRLDEMVLWDAPRNLPIGLLRNGTKKKVRPWNAPMETASHSYEDHVICTGCDRSLLWRRTVRGSINVL